MCSVSVYCMDACVSSVRDMYVLYVCLCNVCSVSVYSMHAYVYASVHICMVCVCMCSMYMWCVSNSMCLYMPV